MPRRGLATLGCATLFAAAGAVAAKQDASSQLPADAGRAELVEFCATCHDAATVVAKRRSRSEWQHVVADMRDKGATVSDADAKTIASYLTRHFGLVDLNTAGAAELEEVLGIARPEADAVVAYRRTHGPFRTIEDLKHVLEVDASRLAAWKDRIVFRPR